VLRRAWRDATIEMQWCPVHKGVLGNEKADEWDKLWRRSQTPAGWNC